METKHTMKLSEHWTDTFVAMGACADAIEWARDIPTWEEFWRTCKRADWMLWGLARITHDPRTFRLACCACAEYSLKNYESEYPDDRRPRNAIEVSRRYANGEATIEELRSAGESARESAESAWSARAAWAALAARAALAAESAEMARETRAARESAWESAESAWESAESEMADLIREIIPVPPELTERGRVK